MSADEEGEVASELREEARLLRALELEPTRERGVGGGDGGVVADLFPNQVRARPEGVGSDGEDRPPRVMEARRVQIGGQGRGRTNLLLPGHHRRGGSGGDEDKEGGDGNGEAEEEEAADHGIATRI